MSGGVTFFILGSSSQGNCALLATPSCRVLIDAGFPARKLDTMLRALGFALGDIDAVFLTHEHSDHCGGITGLSKHPNIQVFANRETAKSVQERLRFRPSWRFFETGATFTFRDLEVTSFSLPHDAADPVGFVFAAGDGTETNPRRRLAWCTDLGYVPELVRQRIREADILVLESNYDLEMLDGSRRSWALKQRIKSRHGHLSNTAAHEVLTTTEGASWRRVFLAHLSRECNNVALVREAFSTFTQNGSRFSVEVIDPNDAGAAMVSLLEI